MLDQRTPHPVMDAAFCVSITTRHDRTKLQSPDQHAANSEASWFFCSVIGLLRSQGNVNALQQHRQHPCTAAGRGSRSRWDRGRGPILDCRVTPTWEVIAFHSGSLRTFSQRIGQITSLPSGMAPI